MGWRENACCGEEGGVRSVVCHVKQLHRCYAVHTTHHTGNGMTPHQRPVNVQSTQQPKPAITTPHVQVTTRSHAVDNMLHLLQHLQDLAVALCCPAALLECCHDRLDLRDGVVAVALVDCTNQLVSPVCPARRALPPRG